MPLNAPAYIIITSSGADSIVSLLLLLTFFFVLSFTLFHCQAFPARSKDWVIPHAL